MKPLTRSKTIWSALLLPLVGWLIQRTNGGELPLILQSTGPLIVAVGIILLRLATTEPCWVCGRTKPEAFPDEQPAQKDVGP